MDKKDRMDAFGATLLVCFSVMLGLNQVLIKLVNAGLQPVFQAGLRSVVAFGPVLIFALLARKKLSISDGSLVPGILCGTFFGVEFLLLYLALDYTSVGRASVFFYSMPFWVAIAAHFMIPGERLTPLRVTGLALAFIGVAWALLKDDHQVTEYAFYGDVACIAAAILWAGIVLLARTTALSKSTPVMQLLYQLSVSGIILVPVSLLFGDLVRDLTAELVAIFLFQALIIVGIGFVIWFWVLSIYPASDMASFGFLTPVFGVIFGWLILDEQVSLSLVGALLLVSVGLVMINRKPKPT